MDLDAVAMMLERSVQVEKLGGGANDCQAWPRVYFIVRLRGLENHGRF